MAQKYCTVCGKPVSDQDKVCPNCGAWNLGQKTTDDTSNTVKANDVSLKRILIPLIVLIALVVFVIKVPISNKGIGASAATPDSIAQADVENPEEAEADAPAAAVEEHNGAEEAPQAEGKPTDTPSVAGTYKGKIVTPTTIRLKQEGNRIFGTIRYTKFDSPALDISGTVDSDGTFELKEYDENRKQSGRITGTIKGNTMSGKFYNPKRDTTTSFELNKE